MSISLYAEQEAKGPKCVTLQDQQNRQKICNVNCLSTIYNLLDKDIWVVFYVLYIFYMIIFSVRMFMVSTCTDDPLGPSCGRISLANT